MMELFNVLGVVAGLLEYSRSIFGRAKVVPAGTLGLDLASSCFEAKNLPLRMLRQINAPETQ